MLIETIIAPVDNSDSAFDLQTDIICGGNRGAKINKENLDKFKIQEDIVNKYCNKNHRNKNKT